VRQASNQAAQLANGTAIMGEAEAHTRAEVEDVQRLLLLNQPTSVNHGAENQGVHQEQHDARDAEGDGAVANRPRILSLLLPRA
jgi:hypothetical protein